MPGQTVLIRAEGLSVPAATVTMGGLPAASVEATAEGLRAVVPALGLPEGSRTTVAVQAPGKPAMTFELLVGRLPLVLEADPASAAIGDTLVLTGRGFSAEPAANAVSVGGQRALVLEATGERLKIVAPAPAVGAGDMPEVPIVVSAGGRTSSAYSGFRLSRAGGGSFMPRFYAAPVPDLPADGLAFVSTELGPVLVLGGPAGAGSTAERALAFAADLNALVAQAASRQIGFEARENPQPAVAVVGDARPLLLATAEDVEAYARPWEGRGSGRRVSAPALARHWAAVLQDYLGLFLYRQRPLKVLAMSSRGQVLADLYGEAARRSPGGTGVPSGLLLPLTPAMARDLRAMALVVSAEPGRAAVALEGRWSGTISDPDLGERPFTVELRSERGRMVGTLTTGRGGITLNSPLRDIGFDRGTARFTTDLQGTSYRFRGALEGNVVSGTIERPGRAPARFTMQYAE
jgi:hypothetical protein